MSSSSTLRCGDCGALNPFGSPCQAPRHDADKRFLDLRASGYTGPVDQDGRIPPAEDLGARILARLREVPEPPARPRGMTPERYREEYDSYPCVVVDRSGQETRFGGAVRAWKFARSLTGARVVR